MKLATATQHQEDGVNIVMYTGLMSKWQMVRGSQQSRIKYKLSTTMYCSYI